VTESDINIFPPKKTSLFQEQKSETYNPKQFFFNNKEQESFFPSNYFSQQNSIGHRTTTQNNSCFSLTVQTMLLSPTLTWNINPTTPQRRRQRPTNRTKRTATIHTMPKQNCKSKSGIRKTQHAQKPQVSQNEKCLKNTKIH
jgi:hypothetical protein